MRECITNRRESASNQGILFGVVKPSLREDVGNKLGFKETNKFGFNRKHYVIKLIIILREG